MRRIFAIMLPLVMVICLAACGSTEESAQTTQQAASETTEFQENETSDGAGNTVSKLEKIEFTTPDESAFTFEDTDMGVAVTGYSGSAIKVIVPAQMGGKDVVEIQSGAFSDGSVLSIKLPDTVTTICDQAFFYNTTLADIEFGQNVQTIGEEAFMGCLALSKVILNEGLTEIGTDAFNTCQSLERIKLPSTLTLIKDGAFYMNGLREIEIPGSVQNVGIKAFGACTQLKSLRIQEGAKDLADGAFYLCEALETAELPASIETFGMQVFDSCPDVTLYGPAESAAEQYATDNEITFAVK